MWTTQEIRRLPLIARPDLRWTQSRVRGETRWNVQDPVSLRTYQLRDPERFLLRQLDGRTTIQDLRRRYESKYLPLKLRSDDLHGFLQLAQQEGLVLADTTGQGSALYQRHVREVQRKRRSRAMQLLAIRLPGVNPTRFLEQVEPWVRWVFHPTATLLLLAFVASALALVITRLDVFSQGIPSWSEIWTSQSAVALMLAVGTTKILHELGHAVTAHYLGVPCREMGVMLLAFVPCLYCDVSDAALLPAKRQRIAISAAGMITELILASVCVWLWWFSEPGLLRQTLLWMAIVCSINTLFINGNPLLRFDGYYILADAWEIPNLYQAGQHRLHRFVERLFMRNVTPRPQLMLTDGGPSVTAYGVAALIYRFVVVGCVLALLMGIMSQLGIVFVGYGLIGVVAFGMVLQPASQTVNKMLQPGKPSQIRWFRVVLLFLIVAGMAAALALIPVRQYQKVPVRFVAFQATPVYVAVPGQLMDARAIGASVARGELIATLRSSDLEAEIQQLKSQRDEQQLYLEQLERAQSVDDTSGDLLPAAKAALQDFEERLSRRLSDSEELTIVAPRDGTILAAPSIPPADAEGQLPSWSGTPLDPKNRNCFLTSGTLICSVGDPTALEVVAIVEQGQIDGVRIGQRVNVRSDQIPGQSLLGRVVEVSQVDAIPERIDQDRNTAVSFRARIALDSVPPMVRVGAPGEARIEVLSESWGERIYRSLRRQFAAF